MSSKPKALLKQAKPKHKKQQILDTADDYQAAGVDYEDAAGKWRAGDAVKSLRFFNRALEVYDQGLQKFPESFDLAYNKARVQLEIATHPILVKQLQEPILIVLRAALESHRYAISLDQDNPDTLFNTSQVLTSIAEEIANSNAPDNSEAVRLLEEALELQSRCLSLQELRYEESRDQQRAAESQSDTVLDDGGDEYDGDGGVAIENSKQQEEQWFSIVEPVTQDTLIDTALAQLGTLTTLCGVLSSSPDLLASSSLSWIEEYSSNILQKNLPRFVTEKDDRRAEIALAKANLVSGLLEAGFRAERLDMETYKRERDGVFSALELGLEQSSEALLANARSLMSFSTALIDSKLNNGANTGNMRWNALSAAITSLGTASKTTGIMAEDLVKTHYLRGDCSLLQHQMGLPPNSYQSAISHGQQLLKNAEVYYRNASKLSQDTDEQQTASFRSAISLYLRQGNKSVLVSETQSLGEAWIISQIEEMMVEGLLSSEFQI